MKSLDDLKYFIIAEYNSCLYCWRDSKNAQSFQKWEGRVIEAWDIIRAAGWEAEVQPPTFIRHFVIK